MSHLRPVLCTDAPFFIERAAAFERGDFAGGLSRLGLNPYPLMLAGLHRAGLDWEMAGRAWSLAFASLAVLPLFGLTRRLFGQRAAMVACLLYAVQPELIEWSPEIIRDPTFWFLLLAALYYSHVAASADRHAAVRYMIAGTCLALAGLIRFEGWFLVLPLVWWTWGTRQASSVLLAAGARLAIAGAMTPLWLVAINIVFLSSHDRWEWGRFDHLLMALHWTIGTDAAAPTTPPLPNRGEGPGARENEPGADSTKSFVPEDASKRPSLKVMCWGMTHTFVRGVHPIYLFAICAGLWAARRQNFLREQMPLGLLAAINLAAVWIYFWSHHEITARYMLLVALVGMPYAGLGVVWISEQLARFSPRESLTPGAKQGITAVLVLAVSSIGCHDALTSEYQSRFIKASLGRWILSRYGAERTVLCSENLERLVGYYAGARHASISPDSTPAEALRRVDSLDPDIVALWMNLPSEQAVVAHYEQLGKGEFHIYRGAVLPRGCHDVAVLVRTGLTEHATTSNSSASEVSLSGKARPLY